MATEREMKAIQKRILHQLLMIKDDREKLDEYINVTKAEMDAEDVAYVEKMLEELKKSKQ